MHAKRCYVLKDELVSIITASYNSESFIRITYNSIVAQKYTNWEWLVTDDCSVDNSYNILKEIQLKDPRVKVFQNIANLGAAPARNKSLSQASGRFIAFLDADDVWREDKLYKQMRFMSDGGFGMSFTAYKVICEKGQYIGSMIDLLAPSTISYQDLLVKKATFGCSTVIIDRGFVGDISMPNLRTGQDYATWLSILKKGCTAHLFREPLTSYRIVKGSISRNKIKKALRQWQIYRDVENLSLLYSIYCFIHYGYRAVFRS